MSFKVRTYRVDDVLIQGNNHIVDLVHRRGVKHVAIEMENDASKLSKFLQLEFDPGVIFQTFSLNHFLWIDET